MTTTRWILLVLIVVAIFASPRTQAGDDYDGRPHYRHHHHHRSAGDYCVTDFWGSCLRVARSRHAYRWRYYHHRRPAVAAPVIFVPGAAERIDHGLFCHARRRVVGEDAAAPLGTGTLGDRKARIAPAERKALVAWMGSVRYDHGERYQDIAYAKDVRQICSFAGYGGTTGRRQFYRCVLEATPCRAPPDAEEERVERRIEIEEDEK